MSTVVLVGSGLQENIGLGYLSAALENQGHHVEIIRFNGVDDTSSCVKSTIAASPSLVGLSIQFQYSIDDYLWLIRQLRLNGYFGHITCGGHVPTFCGRELLMDAPGLNSAVMNDGEYPIVEIAKNIDKNQDPKNIPGLIWREGTSIHANTALKIVKDLNTLPAPKRLLKPKSVAGIPQASVIASRGCVGRCTYCSINAYAGSAGGMRYRLRSEIAVADEIHALVVKSGVRLIMMQDDLFILPDPAKAIKRLDTLASALAAKQMPQTLFWMKGCPESITDEVTKAAKNLGTAFLFLGVENSVEKRLRYLGRRHTLAQSQAAIERLVKNNIQPSFNLMILDPDSTLAEVEANIDFARQYLGLPWNICRTEVYSGTVLEMRLKRQGRLLNSYRGWDYEIADTGANILFKILRHCFEHRAFSCDSLHNSLITLLLAAQVHSLLMPGKDILKLKERIDTLARDIQQDTINELMRLIAYVRSADPNDSEAHLNRAIETTLAVNERDHPRLTEIDSLLLALSTRSISERTFL